MHRGRWLPNWGTDCFEEIREVGQRGIPRGGKNRGRGYCWTEERGRGKCWGIYYFLICLEWHPNTQ